MMRMTYNCFRCDLAIEQIYLKSCLLALLRLLLHTKINLFTRYSKDEYLKPGNPLLHSFTYLLIETKSRYSEEMKLLHETHDDVEFIDCFSSIGLQYQFFPVKIKTRPCIGILRRKVDISSDYLDDQFTEETSSESDVGSDEIIDDLKESLLLDPPTQIEEDIDIIRELSSTIEFENPNDLHGSFSAFNNLPESSRPNQSNTKSKLKRLIESHFRSKGSVIESDKESDKETTDESSKDKNSESNNIVPSIVSPHTSAKANIKRIIKAEQIKELVENISKLDLNAVCDLEHLSTKECLKKIIDDYDVKMD